MRTDNKSSFYGRIKELLKVMKRNIELKYGKVTDKLKKGKWGLLCRGATSKGAYELVCTLKTPKIPFNSISYWLRDEYDAKDFLPVKEYVEQK